MPTSAGTKVKDPNQTIPEAVGIVTSDSLAGESLKHSGTFGANNPKAAASKQPSHSTTTNTTDTSGANKLPPAPDAETRDAQLGKTADQELDEGVGHGKELGRGPTYNIKDEDKHTSNSKSSDNKSSSSSKSSHGKSHHSHSKNSSDGDHNGAEVRGGYAGADHKALPPGVLEPKGKNLTETNDLQGKRVYPEIGTEKDPGRLAELDREQRALRSGADAASTKSKLEVEESRFSKLEEQSA